MKYNIITAETDLGVHVDGSKEAPKVILDNMNIDKALVKRVISKNIIKEKIGNKKNLSEINLFNKKLYDNVYESCKNNCIPITIGGDHSIAIGSALGSINFHDNLGIIWIDSHGDYNTFETTESGNIHGLPFAAITGYKNKELVKFHEGNLFNPKNACLVGVRDLSPYELEKANLLDSGITIFTTEDIKNLGAEYVMNKAFEIASKNTNGVHISYDIDVIDPNIAKGVSVPAVNGINEKEAFEIANKIKDNLNLVKSIDLVEYNPKFDYDRKTLEIAINILNIILKR